MLGVEYMHLDIPPGQARDFSESLYFSGSALQPKGRLSGTTPLWS
jgi:hypothetical protein